MRNLMLIAGMLVCGCAIQPQTTAVRIDGRPIKGDAALERQFEIDQSICRGEVAKADTVSAAPLVRRQAAGADIFTGCMAQRGYVPKQP